MIQPNLSDPNISEADGCVDAAKNIIVQVTLVAPANYSFNLNERDIDQLMTCTPKSTWSDPKVFQADSFDNGNGLVAVLAMGESDNAATVRFTPDDQVKLCQEYKDTLIKRNSGGF